MAEERIVVALYPDREAVQKAVENLSESDRVPMDRVSMLGSAYGIGDDPIGVYYPSAGERVRGWGKLGAFWGGLWGLLAGAAGFFVLPGIGPVMAAGPLVEALAGGAAGAAVGGGAMAGAGGLSHLANALHTQGIPQEELEQLQQAIREGHYLVLVRCGVDCDSYKEALGETCPEGVKDFPYRRIG